MLHHFIYDFKDILTILNKCYLKKINLFLIFCNSVCPFQRVSGLPSIFEFWLCDPFVVSVGSLPVSSFSFLIIIIWLPLCPASRRSSAVQDNICIRLNPRTTQTHTHKAIMPGRDCSGICIKEICLFAEKTKLN